MMQNDSEELVAKLRELALEGNAFALRFLMERLSPRPKERLIYLPLPKITNSQDAVEAETRILEAVGQGEITIGEGTALTKLVGAHRAHANIAALQSAPKPAQYNTTKSPLHYSSEDEIDDFSFGGDDIPGETEPGWHGSNSNVSAATRTELSGNGDPKPTLDEAAFEAGTEPRPAVVPNPKLELVPLTAGMEGERPSTSESWRTDPQPEQEKMQTKWNPQIHPDPTPRPQDRWDVSLSDLDGEAERSTERSSGLRTAPQPENDGTETKWNDQTQVDPPQHQSAPREPGATPERVAGGGDWRTEQSPEKRGTGSKRDKLPDLVRKVEKTLQREERRKSEALKTEERRDRYGHVIQDDFPKGDRGWM